MNDLVLDRVSSLQDGLTQHGVDLAIIAPSAEMYHLIGRKLPLTERFNAVLLPRSGRPRIIVPRLQVPLVQDLARIFDVEAWGETDSPLARVAAYGEDIGARTIAVNGHFWSSFLLRLQNLRPQARFVDASPITAAARLHKDEREIALLTDAARRFDAIWADFFANGRLVGVTERDVVRQIGERVAAQGFDPMAWCDVGSGPNGASPLHHHSDRVIQPGDPVVIDFAATLDGYYMDTCRTPVAGEPDPSFVVIYDVVNAALEAASHAIRPGVEAQAIDRAARQVIEAAGHGPQFLHRLGHGLGIEAHEEPYIIDGNALKLAPGMVFSNEPGIYIEGRWGVRIENIMLVTNEGGRSFNDATRALTVMR
ncbi:MAG: aminopeptidase P family protein [Chelatococcus sp.]|uniref:M24 family metallopeptidase n=1 Tax=Chelatococcus sp. TaxID=1953771 RepID=UPI0025BA8A0B|nr:Xaa-Pro peptidase family protein [Chelatococcus sp.]MBX3539835.1 aminopeptidase P family protein [Chelatococcus sp.]